MAGLVDGLPTPHRITPVSRAPPPQTLESDEAEEEDPVSSRKRGSRTRSSRHEQFDDNASEDDEDDSDDDANVDLEDLTELTPEAIEALEGAVFSPGDAEEYDPSKDVPADAVLLPPSRALSGWLAAHVLRDSEGSAAAESVQSRAGEWLSSRRVLPGPHPGADADATFGVHPGGMRAGYEVDPPRKTTGVLVPAFSEARSGAEMMHNTRPLASARGVIDIRGRRVLSSGLYVGLSLRERLEAVRLRSKERDTRFSAIQAQYIRALRAATADGIEQSGAAQAMAAHLRSLADEFEAKLPQSAQPHDDEDSDDQDATTIIPPGVSRKRPLEVREAEDGGATSNRAKRSKRGKPAAVVEPTTTTNTPKEEEGVRVSVQQVAAALMLQNAQLRARLAQLTGRDPGLNGADQALRAAAANSTRVPELRGVGPSVLRELDEVSLCAVAGVQSSWGEGAPVLAAGDYVRTPYGDGWVMEQRDPLVLPVGVSHPGGSDAERRPSRGGLGGLARVQLRRGGYVSLPSTRVVLVSLVGEATCSAGRRRSEAAGRILARSSFHQHFDALLEASRGAAADRAQQAMERLFQTGHDITHSLLHSRYGAGNQLVQTHGRQIRETARIESVQAALAAAVDGSRTTNEGARIPGEEDEGLLQVDRRPIFRVGSQLGAPRGVPLALDPRGASTNGFVVGVFDPFAPRGVAKLPASMGGIDEATSTAARNALVAILETTAGPQGVVAAISRLRSMSDAGHMASSPTTPDRAMQRNGSFDLSAAGMDVATATGIVDEANAFKTAAEASTKSTESPLFAFLNRERSFDAGSYYYSGLASPMSHPAGGTSGPNAWGFADASAMLGPPTSSSSGPGEDGGSSAEAHRIGKAARTELQKTRAELQRLTLRLRLSENVATAQRQRLSEARWTENVLLERLNEARATLEETREDLRRRESDAAELAAAMARARKHYFKAAAAGWEGADDVTVREATRIMLLEQQQQQKQQRDALANDDEAKGSDEDDEDDDEEEEDDEVVVARHPRPVEEDDDDDDDDDEDEDDEPPEDAVGSLSALAGLVHGEKLDDSSAAIALGGMRAGPTSPGGDGMMSLVAVAAESEQAPSTESNGRRPRRGGRRSWR
jgi:hypothetical protein